MLFRFGIVAAVTVVLFFLVERLVNSPFGRVLRGIRDDEQVVQVAGKNVVMFKIKAFAFGTAALGLAGGLYGHFKMTITPTGFDFTKSIEIVVMVILGGMGNTIGVILAAILLTLLPELLRPIAEYRMVLYSFLLIVLMLARPQGLFNFKFAKAKS